MRTTADIFTDLCQRALDEKDLAEAKRNDAIARHICFLLTSAVQNGEESDEMLTRRANELVNEAATARCEIECDEDDGSYALHLMAYIQTRVEDGKVNGVRNVKEGERIIIGEFAIA